MACGRVNPDIFESDDVTNSCLVSYRTINQYGGTTATTGQICRHYRSLGYYYLWRTFWTHLIAEEPWYYSKSGYHRMRVDKCGRGNFWIRKEKFGDSKISGYVWTGSKRWVLASSYLQILCSCSHARILVKMSEECRMGIRVGDAQLASFAYFCISETKPDAGKNISRIQPDCFTALGLTLVWLQKDEEREGEQIPLGEELLRERDTRLSGKAGMLPRQRCGTENFKGSLSTCVFKTATATGREHFAC